ncbi:MAG: FliA/WhiG family RNA polymerase sigma factor [Phycisphaerae bacterium]|nr:FliA/WhiG family RNA polymerase sigma factor [Phycisphaerae bacterium]
MAVRVAPKSASRGKSAARSAPTRTAADLSKWPIHDVFEEYKKSRCERIRNYLMEKFLPLVRYNAERIHTRLPDEVDVDDLVSAGVFGLKDAIENFDLGRKVKFETYCAPRIRGAILDELRSMDWVPRLVRHRTARVEGARQQIEMESGQPASDRQIADRIGISMEDFEKYKRDSVARNTRSLSARCFPSDGSRDVREIDVIKDETQINPLAEMHRRDLKDLITKGLSRAERLIIILYYYEGMTMKEIGATLDLSESRVSQMHSSVLLRLKAQMQHRSRELEPVE